MLFAWQLSENWAIHMQIYEFIRYVFASSPAVGQLFITHTPRERPAKQKTFENRVMDLLDGRTDGCQQTDSIIYEQLFAYSQSALKEI